MELTEDEAGKLVNICASIRKLANQIESLRPAGGFGTKVEVKEPDYIALAWNELNGMDFREPHDRFDHYDNAIEYFKKGIEQKDKLIKQLRIDALTAGLVSLE